MQILVVDDQRFLLDALQLAIQARRPELQVEVAADAAQALHRAAVLQPELILLDWWLREQPADGLFARLLDQCPRTRIVVMSGDDSASLVAHVLELGASGFLRKADADLDAMRHAIDVVLAGGIYLPGHLPGGSSVSPSVRRGWVGRELVDCFPQLTPRQLDVLRIMLRGASNKVIAAELGIGEVTVKSHVAAILGTLGVGSRSQAVSLAASQGARIA